ncbi:hypothetical protein AMAG_04656 [Allomyces macrogynus ATCC 38327]|uniref:Uncharacterized protein n=1 Tax=Allomyces macrogynus (strain ATCC 38327) TaxID=578462 RepID=A0A0L0S613_ALLM3|nr:hypothetical protein AMAG_04656 [Allomyces macrogynus ATCC 38327]|eukprot:KNE57809.1 hypothetical protein AMAG_04656 [Allomyces macrogynus ATCC 38327]
MTHDRPNAVAVAASTTTTTASLTLLQYAVLDDDRAPCRGPAVHGGRMAVRARLTGYCHDLDLARVPWTLVVRYPSSRAPHLDRVIDVRGSQPGPGPGSELMLRISSSSATWFAEVVVPPRTGENTTVGIEWTVSLACPSSINDATWADPLVAGVRIGADPTLYNVTRRALRRRDPATAAADRDATTRLRAMDDLGEPSFWMSNLTILIGAGALCLVLIVIVLCICRRRRRALKSTPATDSSISPTSTTCATASNMFAQPLGAQGAPPPPRPVRDMGTALDSPRGPAPPGAEYFVPPPAPAAAAAYGPSPNGVSPRNPSGPTVRFDMAAQQQQQLDAPPPPRRNQRDSMTQTDASPAVFARRDASTSPGPVRVPVMGATPAASAAAAAGAPARTTSSSIPSIPSSAPSEPAPVRLVAKPPKVLLRRQSQPPSSRLGTGSDPSTPLATDDVEPDLFEKLTILLQEHEDQRRRRQDEPGEPAPHVDSMATGVAVVGTGNAVPPPPRGASRDEKTAPGPPPRRGASRDGKTAPQRPSTASGGVVPAQPAGTAAPAPIAMGVAPFPAVPSVAAPAAAAPIPVATVSPPAASVTTPVPATQPVGRGSGSSAETASTPEQAPKVAAPAALQGGSGSTPTRSSDGSEHDADASSMRPPPTPKLIYSPRQSVVSVPPWSPTHRSFPRNSGSHVIPPPPLDGPVPNVSAPASPAVNRFFQHPPPRPTTLQLNIPSIYVIPPSTSTPSVDYPPYHDDDEEVERMSEDSRLHDMEPRIRTGGYDDDDYDEDEDDDEFFNYDPSIDPYTGEPHDMAAAAGYAIQKPPSPEHRDRWRQFQADHDADAFQPAAAGAMRHNAAAAAAPMPEFMDSDPSTDNDSPGPFSHLASAAAAGVPSAVPAVPLPPKAPEPHSPTVARAPFPAAAPAPAALHHVDDDDDTATESDEDATEPDHDPHLRLLRGRRLNGSRTEEEARRRQAAEEEEQRRIRAEQVRRAEEEEQRRIHAEQARRAEEDARRLLEEQQRQRAQEVERERLRLEQLRREEAERRRVEEEERRRKQEEEEERRLEEQRRLLEQQKLAEQRRRESDERRRREEQQRLLLEEERKQRLQEELRRQQMLQEARRRQQAADRRRQEAEAEAERQRRAAEAEAERVRRLEDLQMREQEEQRRAEAELLQQLEELQAQLDWQQPDPTFSSDPNVFTYVSPAQQPLPPAPPQSAPVAAVVAAAAHTPAPYVTSVSAPAIVSPRPRRSLPNIAERVAASQPTPPAAEPAPVQRVYVPRSQFVNPNRTRKPSAGSNRYYPPGAPGSRA